MAEQIERQPTPWEYSGQLLRAIDGDTQRLVVFTFIDETRQFVCRILGIDTAERKDYDAWLAAKNHAISLLTDPEIGPLRVKVHFTGKVDVYGRWLIYITLPDGRDFSAAMIEDGYGVAREWASQMEALGVVE